MFAWSGCRSLLAFAIMAVTSADPANSLAGGGLWAAGCCANAAAENSARIVQNIGARMECLLWAAIVHASALDRVSNVHAGGGKSGRRRAAPLISRS